MTTSAELFAEAEKILAKARAVERYERQLKCTQKLDQIKAAGAGLTDMEFFHFESDVYALAARVGV